MKVEVEKVTVHTISAYSHFGESSRGALEVLGKHGVGMREGDNIVEVVIAHQPAIVNTFFQKRLSRRITYTSGGVHTQMDYIVCRRKELKRVKDCKVLPKEAAAKHHKVVVCNAEIITRGNQRTKKQKKTRWWKLNESEQRTEYAGKAEDKLESINEEERSWETVSKAMRDTAAEVLGKSSGKSGKKEETWWWDEEVQQAVASKRELKKERDLNRCVETIAAYKQASKNAKRVGARARSAALRDLYESLNGEEGKERKKDRYRDRYKDWL